MLIVGGWPTEAGPRSCLRQAIRTQWRCRCRRRGRPRIFDVLAGRHSRLPTTHPRAGSSRSRRAEDTQRGHSRPRCARRSHRGLAAAAVRGGHPGLPRQAERGDHRYAQRHRPNDGQLRRLGFETFRFESSASITSYQWDFGDGTPPQDGVSVTHTFSDTGAHTVTLTVSDSAGRSDTATEHLGGCRAGGRRRSAPRAGVSV